MKHLLPHGRAWLAAGAASVVSMALSAPPLRSLIEQSMVWHMVIQMPMLVLSGWLVRGAVRHAASASRLGAWNRYGLTGFIAALAISAYWMLPVSIDRAVVLPVADLAKLGSLLVCGLLLKDSFDRAPAPLQLFFVGYGVPMMIWLGLYFASTDLRLCNAYSLESQVRAGQSLAVLGVVLGALWLGRLLWPRLARHKTPGRWGDTAHDDVDRAVNKQG